ncbi:hypothetical protein ACFY36_14915 [Actinoplanes sp. NPDC000266]
MIETCPSILATLAVAEELRQLRSSTSGIQTALQDGSGLPAGFHVRVIADQLERMQEEIRRLR